ncbi:MAG: AGE family epimerase/isomerase [Bacteroidota bacterium]
MQLAELSTLRNEVKQHLTQELLPFWTARMMDAEFGGFITHFDEWGKDIGTDEKSLISQTRSIYTLASAHRAGWGAGKYADMAKEGVDFLLNKMWDGTHGGFFWMCNRQGKVTETKKIIYGHSFAIYALSEYSLATGDKRGLEYAQRVFDLLQIYALDSYYGGYFEMFEADWTLCGPGSGGGDRKTLDVHMHLMEAFTTLYEASGKEIHKRKLLEDIQILRTHMMHPTYRTGIPQFWPDWREAPQIKFDIVWGWDRFAEGGAKPSSTNNTSYGHNVELAWLLLHALRVINEPLEPYLSDIQTLMDHAVAYGIDEEFGGVYVEGAHEGPVYDREKEFWQQSEVMIGMLDACLVFGTPKYWEAYKKVHRFVFDKMIHRPVGEWWPLMSREGEPIWRHMSHSWKVNYHTVRAMVQCDERLERLEKINLG